MKCFYNDVKGFTLFWNPKFIGKFVRASIPDNFPMYTHTERKYFLFGIKVQDRFMTS